MTMATNSASLNRTEMSPGPVSPKRYHPALVTLHWLIAVLIFGAFFLSQGNEGGDRERFRPGQGNFPPAGQQANPTQGFQPGNPPAGFPRQGDTQSIFSAIG